jgi:hypothetical protein
MLKVHPFVFDLLIVRRCALRLCFFLASRASAYLLRAVGAADFFSAFALVSGTALGSELTTGVVLIFISPQFFLLPERPLSGSGRSFFLSRMKDCSIVHCSL